MCIPKYFTDLTPKIEIDYNIKDGNKLFWIAELKDIKISMHYRTRYSSDSIPTKFISLEVFKSNLLAFI